MRQKTMAVMRKCMEERMCGIFYYKQMTQEVTDSPVVDEEV